jgi:hypothetical protein
MAETGIFQKLPRSQLMALRNQHAARQDAE